MIWQGRTPARLNRELLLSVFTSVKIKSENITYITSKSWREGFSEATDSYWTFSLMNAKVSQHHGIILVERAFLNLIYSSLLLKAGIKSLLLALFFQAFDFFFFSLKINHQTMMPNLLNTRLKHSDQPYKIDEHQITSSF